jgi:hypothetical protein
MSDTFLLLTGTAVFSLMLIGVVLTVLEFNQMQKNGDSTNREKSALSAATAHSRSEDRD